MSKPQKAGKKWTIGQKKPQSIVGRYSHFKETQASVKGRGSSSFPISTAAAPASTSRTWKTNARQAESGISDAARQQTASAEAQSPNQTDMVEQEGQGEQAGFAAFQFYGKLASVGRGLGRGTSSFGRGGGRGLGLGQGAGKTSPTSHEETIQTGRGRGEAGQGNPFLSALERRRGRGRGSPGTAAVQSSRGYVAKSIKAVLPPHRRRSLEQSKARLDQRNLEHGTTQASAIVVDDEDKARGHGIGAADGNVVMPSGHQAHQADRPHSRFQETATKTSLHVKGVPVEFNTPQILGQHFQQFGKVHVRCNRAKCFATVYFSSHEEAAQAKAGGRQIGPDLTVKLFWNAQEGAPSEIRRPVRKAAAVQEGAYVGQEVEQGVYGDREWLPDGTEEEDVDEEIEDGSYRKGRGRKLRTASFSSAGARKSTFPFLSGGMQHDAKAMNSAAGTSSLTGVQASSVLQPGSFQPTHTLFSPGVTSPTSGGFFHSGAVNERVKMGQTSPRIPFGTVWQGGGFGTSQKTTATHTTANTFAGFASTEQATNTPLFSNVAANTPFSGNAAAFVQKANRTPLFSNISVSTQQTSNAQLFSSVAKSEASSTAQTPGFTFVPTRSSNESHSLQLGAAAANAPSVPSVVQPNFSAMSTGAVQNGKKGKMRPRSEAFSSKTTKTTTKKTVVFGNTEQLMTEKSSIEMKMGGTKPRPAAQQRRRQRRKSANYVQPVAIPNLPPPPPVGDDSSAEAKYNALEERDKMLRQGVSRDSDVKTARKLVGTCPDMCPEKERHMREAQRLVSVFEALDESVESGGFRINHALAVKEFTRSSADKEEPLPHEVRPLPVLLMTMDYLCTTVMNRDKIHPAEWFDFLWNRTRAIRKDIVVQDLCNLDCVLLIERCTRFHVVCSHHLCEMDHSAFDPKMNDENMMKCIQSLKHDYADLRDKDTVCPNEAEFMAYDILLHLNETDMLRRILHYPAYVRQSAEVQFAISVFNAINDNNYITFFRLLKRTTHLNACLMHRYFRQVRVEALRVMERSYTVPNIPPVRIPLSEVEHILAFESVDEVTAFCQFHSIAVDESNMILKRGSFNDPEELLQISRAPRLIDSKRDCSLGQVVYGGSLPAQPLHQPENSFTDQSQTAVGESPKIEPKVAVDFSTAGQFAVTAHAIRETGMASQEKLILVKKSGRMSQETTIPVRETQNQVIEERISAKQATKIASSVSTSLLSDVVEQAVHHVAVDYLTTVHQRFSSCRHWADDAISSAVQEEMTTAAADCLKKRKEELEQRERVTHLLMSDILQEVVSAENQKICNSVAREYIRKVAKRRDAIIQELAKEICDEGVRRLTDDVARNTLAAARRERTKRLSEIRKKLEQDKLKRILRGWVKAYRCRKRARDALESFPVTPSCLPTSALLGNQLSSRASSPVVPSYLLLDELAAERANLCHAQREELWLPIDLSSTVKGALSPSWLESVNRTEGGRSLPATWQLLVSVADSTTEPDEWLVDWLQTKLDTGSSAPEPDRVKAWQCDSVGLPGCQLFVCCKGMQGKNLKKQPSAQTLQATNAVLFATSSELYEDATRLHSLLQVCRKSSSSPALAVCIVSHSNLGHNINHLGLDEMQRLGLVSSYFSISVDWSGAGQHEQLLDGLLWCLKESPPSRPQLACLTLTDYLEQGLSRHCFAAVYDNRINARDDVTACMDEVSIVALYNATVDHLANVLTDAQLMRVKWPPYVLNNFETVPGLPRSDWNDRNYLRELHHVLLDMKFPPLDQLPSHCDWTNRCQHCLTYCAELFRQLPLSPDICESAIQKVKTLLDDADKHRGRFLECASSVSMDIGGAVLFPWLAVFEFCFQQALSSLTSHSSVLSLKSREQADGLPLVYFQRKQFEDFVPRVNLQQNISVRVATLPASSRVGRRRRDTSDDNSPLKRSRLVHQTPTVAVSSPLTVAHRRTVSEGARFSAHRVSALRSKLDAERRQNSRFEDSLVAALRGDNEVDTSLCSPESQASFSFIEDSRRKDSLHVMTPARLSLLHQDIWQMKRSMMVDDLALKHFTDTFILDPLSSSKRAKSR